jgi:hypothetical protein
MLYKRVYCLEKNPTPTFIEEIAKANISKLDYSLMDEFSIRLFNALYYKTSNLDDLIISK